MNLLDYRPLNLELSGGKVGQKFSRSPILATVNIIVTRMHHKSVRRNKFGLTHKTLAPVC